jgi:predicted HicB family RNase H-like nuclease
MEEQMQEIDATMEREIHEKILQAAYDLYAHTPDWVSFFRNILGISGIVRQLCEGREALSRFERSDAYSEIQQMLTRLRERCSDNAIQQEATKVITVRLPKSLHDALKAEAHDHRTSMNRLCISKLLQFIDTQLVPTDS